MLIIVQQTENEIILRAFSYKNAELDAASRVLERYGIPSTDVFVQKDKAGRLGRGWSIPLSSVRKLEVSLGIRFIRSGEEIVATPEDGEGREFCCREITRSGDGDGRQPIKANAEDDAVFKCALVARAKHWLGGVPTPGRCR